MRSLASNAEIETVAKRMCLAEGLDPDEVVIHAEGCELTGSEHASTPPPTGFRRIASQRWRLYRALAERELRLHDAEVEQGGKVVSLRR